MGHVECDEIVAEKRRSAWGATVALASILVLLGTLDAPRADAQGDPVRYAIGSPVLQDLWVDPVAGSDSNSGASRAAALRTVTAAWNRIPMASTLTGTGYRIRLVAGTYPEAAVPVYWESRWGTAAFPVVVEAADGPGTARLPGMNVFDCRYLYLVGLHVEAGGGDVLHCERCDHFLVRHATVRGRAPATYAVQETIKINQSQHVYVEDSDVSGGWDNAIDNVAVQYCWIRGNVIHDAGDWCLYLKGGSAYFRVEGNEFHHCGTGGFTAGQGTGFEYMVSPWLHYEAYDVAFVNNLVHDVEGAGMGVNGGYDVLFAHNTFYRVGSRSHVFEAVFGSRSCDGITATCEANRLAGGWGSPSDVVPIPNRHVYVYSNLFYNPPGFQSQWQHFTIDGPQSPPAGSNVASPARTDDDLRIRGNLVWNGPSDHPLGLGESTGCRDSNPTCNATQLLADNSINQVQPQLVDPENGVFRPAPGSNLFGIATWAIPAFPGGDRPSPPSSPAGELAVVVGFDRDGVARSGAGIPGAFAGVDCSSAVCGDGTVAAGCETCDDGNTANGDGCSAMCTPDCPAHPRTDCRRPVAAAKSILVVTDSAIDSRDKLSWIWGAGAATTREEFGSPTAPDGANYRFCAWDRSGGTDHLVLSLDIAPGVAAGGACGQPVCWRETSRGYKYAAGAGLDPEGLLLLKLDAGSAGRARITLKASGAHLATPALPLLQADRVTAQLSAGSGPCWEAVFGSPARLSDAGRFKDLSD
ncbi:MAG: right-handed parallel beta-helix repeat-containing protein [Alphaproteobacteria bacterium]